MAGECPFDGMNAALSAAPATYGTLDIKS